MNELYNTNTEIDDYLTQPNDNLRGVGPEGGGGGGTGGLTTVRCTDGSINTATSGSICTISVSSAYLKKTDADNKYQTKTDASATYLTKTDASSTYQTKTATASTYLTKTDAASTYATKTDTSSFATKTELSGKQDKLTAGANITIVDNVISSTGGGGGGTSYTAGEGISISGLTISADFTKVASATSVSGKQDALSAAQLGAANSGITSTKVSSYDTHVADTATHVTSQEKTTWSGKLDKLTAGSNVSIVDNVISASGGGTRTYDKFVVVGVYGQSNAVGYDESSLTKYDVPFDSARIMQYSDSLKPLTFCAENLQNMNTVQARNAAEQGNMRTVRSGSDPDLITSAVDRLTYVATKGIHLPLANLICSVIPDDYGVIIVPGAYGGQGIDAFVRGQNYYTQFLNRIKAALALNENNVLAGIVWCQGEFNVGSVASTYIQKFEGIVNNLHEDIKAAHPRQLVDTYTPKNYWFVFEWPEYWRRNDSTNLLGAYKDSMGADHYVDIPVDTPANTTGYTSATAAAHYGQDSYRKVIAPRVFAKMHAAGVFNTVATASGGGDISQLEEEVEEVKVEVASQASTYKGYINMLIDKINELAQQHPGEVDPFMFDFPVSSDTVVLSSLFTGKQPTLQLTDNSITIGNGGGWGLVTLDESVTHFEATMSTLVSGNNAAVMVATDGNDGTGVGFFLNTISSNKAAYITNGDKGFNGTTPGSSWTPHAPAVGDKLVMDIVGNTVTVKVVNGDTTYTIFDQDISGGVSGYTAFNKPRLGFFGAWASNGTFAMTNVKMTSPHL